MSKKRDYNTMIDRRKFFDQPVNIDMEKYENIWKIASDENDNYPTGCLQDYPFYNKRLILIQNQYIKLIWKSKFFYYWRSERNCFGFFSRNSDRIMYLTCFNKYQYKMTQYNSVNLKLSNSQLNKLKSGIKNGMQ